MIVDRLFFDFDIEKGKEATPENLAPVQGEVQRFTRFWLSHQTTPTIFFSGSKGFSVNVFFRPLLPYPLEGVKKNRHPAVDMFLEWLEGLGGELSLKYLDPSRLGDMIGVQRLPYTIHPKTKRWCFPITLGELMLPTKRLLRLARAPLKEGAFCLRVGKRGEK